MSRLVRVAALATVIVGSGASACARSGHARAGNATLRIAAAVPRARIQDSGLNPIVSFLAKDALVANSPDGHPQPNLAESWSWDASRTRLRLRLRDGSTTCRNAHDVVQSQPSEGSLDGLVLRLRRKPV